ncbi:Hypothetical protein R9X50_00025300 [Acrodontium crateriforme]|uniref:Laccase n=1 Tax=Acrodontium crateriforme TaxID=150365 RepID=A0AAQ3R917_9PEZI|nr:Hypothetical protein R9X50_00025300 [Acrodontium crateriforme]
MVLVYSIIALGLAVPNAYAQGINRKSAPGNAASSRQISSPFSGRGQSAGSPAYNYMFEKPLPIPAIAQPSFETRVNGRTIQYFESTIEPLTLQIYPDLGPAHLVGYNGTVPGPTYVIKRGTETVIRYLNNGNVSSAVHLHGSYTHAVWDGWADDDLKVGEYKDYYYPNSESARPMWYHDHAEGHTASDAYYGQAGVYIIYDPAEDALGLPKGKYDVPLALTDKVYQANGDLKAPQGINNFFGDVIQVNEQPWPYLAVEPRKYRLRFFDMSLSRPFSLYFADPTGSKIDFEVIASDSGLFGGPVKTNDITIAMGERYEVVIDFARFADKNITLGNDFNLPQQIQEFNNTDKVMRFVVGNSVSDNSNNGDVPTTLNSNIQWPPKRTTVDHRFNFQLGGESTWTINGVDFNDVNNRVLARPPQGTVELWELHHSGGPAVHPVHVHLVNLQIVSRKGGSRGVLPYEAAGLKDVVLLEPGETVQVLAYYGPWNGVYMFHCHNLVHEDNTMMVAFNVTALSALGYDFNTTQRFADPQDSAFAAQIYNADAFKPAAVSSAVVSLASLNAYAPASALVSAEAKYYATAGYHGDAAATSTEADKSKITASLRRFQA